MKVETYAGIVTAIEEHAVKGTYRSENGNILEGFGLPNHVFQGGKPSVGDLIVLRVTQENRDQRIHITFEWDPVSDEDKTFLDILPEEKLGDWLRAYQFTGRELTPPSPGQ